MSTILKALQRLEDEKSAKRGRSLEQRIVAQRAPAERSRRGVWLGGAALASLALGATALWLWRAETRSGADDASEAHAAAEARAPEAALAAAQSAHDAERTAAARSAARERAADRAKRRRSARSGGDAAAPAPEAAEEIPLVEVVKRLDPQPADSPPTAQAASREQREIEARVAGALAAAAPPAAAPPAATAPRPADTIARAETPVRSETAAAAATSAAAATPPSAAQRASAQPAVAAESAARASAASGPHSALSAAPPASAAGAARGEQVVARVAIPELTVARTIWHPDAERRLAIVRSIESGEEVRLRVGDAYGPLVVEAIHPSGVLFDHEGVEIQYSVGR